MTLVINVLITQKQKENQIKENFLEIRVSFINFNDTLVTSTHTLQVNIFNLEGGEIMLAWGNENFRTPG